MRLDDLVVQPSDEDDDLRNDKFGNTSRIAVGGIEDSDAAEGRGVKIDLVRTDAVGADGKEARCIVKHALCELRPGADPEERNALERLDESILPQGAGMGRDFETG